MLPLGRREGLLVLLLAAHGLPARAGAAADPVSSVPRATDHLVSRLVAERTAAVPGHELRIGLLLEHAPHWHTYWINPGDSGLPTRLDLRLPEGVEAGAIEWPAPQRFDLGGIVNYGYEGRVLLPLRLRLPADYPHARLSIEARGRWLVCRSECLPGSAEYRLEVPVSERSAPSAWQEDFARADERLPRVPAGMRLQVAEQGEDLRLLLRGGPDGTPDAWQLYPRTPRLVANAAPPRWAPVAGGWQILWRKSEFYTGLPSASEWVLRLPDRALALSAGGSSEPGAGPSAEGGQGQDP